LAGNRGDAISIASALQRNTNIQTLRLLECEDDFIIPIYQTLTSPDSTSHLKNIIIESSDGGGLSESLAEQFQQYLAGATIQSLEMVDYQITDCLTNVFETLAQHTHVNELVFTGCAIEGEDENGNDDDDPGRHLAHLVQNKPNLSVLHMWDCDFFESQQFSNAVSELLTRRGGSALQCLGIYRDNDPAVGLMHYLPPIAVFRTLMSAISRSTRLEHFIIGNIIMGEFEDHLRELENAIPLFRIKELTLDFLEESHEEEIESRLLRALKRNYVVQNVRCSWRGGKNNWLSETGQCRLNFYLNRNRKLAQWVENPKLVPRDLWPEAMKLAFLAGKESLYQSLLKL